jgi:hypothetical protein
MVSGGLYQIELKRLSSTCERLTKIRKLFTFWVLRLVSITEGAQPSLALADVNVALVSKITKEGVHERESSMPPFRH